MQDTAWKFSDEEPVDEYVQPVEGPQYLQIVRAEVSDDEMYYTLVMKSLTNDAFVNLRYFLYATNDAGELIPDAKQRRTLVSLKKALYGPTVAGIPNPVDIIGAVAEGDVKLSESKKSPGTFYPRVYNFKPVPESIAEGFGAEGQYSVPDDEGALEE